MNRIKLFALMLCLLSVSELFAARVQLQILPPKSDNGYKVEGYFIELRDQFADYWKTVGEINTSSVCVIDNLRSGIIYEIRVSSFNRCGLGNPSLPVRVGPLSEEFVYHVVIQSLPPADCPYRPAEVSPFTFDPLSKYKNSTKITIPFKR